MTYSLSEITTAQTLSLPKGWKIVSYTIAAMSILGGTTCLYFGFKTGEDIGMLLLVLCPILFLFGLYTGIENHISKVIITSNSIIYITTFGKKTLTTDQISGFKINGETLYILPIDNSFKKIKITGFNYLKDTVLLIEWLYEHTIDLNVQENEKMKSSLLADDSLGRNTEERKEKIAQAFKVTKWLKWIAAAIMIWTIFTPSFKIAVIVNLLFIILLFGVLFHYKGIIKFYNEKRESIHPGIDMGIILPCFAIFLKSLGITSYDSTNLMVYMAISTVFLSILLIAATKEFKHRKWKDYFITFNILFIFCMYSYGMLSLSNSIFDESIPDKFIVNIKEKDVDFGKYKNTYKFNTPEWGPLRKTQVEVSKNLYNSLETGEGIVIYLKKGLLGSSWYFVQAL